jgi:putative oxidoreductase
MTTEQTSTPGRSCGPLARVWTGLTGLGTCVPAWVIGLFARVGIAGVFWRSGQTKVSGWEITGSTYFLFQDEYKVPVLPPDLAAQLATAAEHIFPVLLILGLFTRLSALGLLGMTVVIQVFVYPNSWPDHAVWASALLLILLKGPGPLSLDAVFGRLWCRRRG